MKCQGSCTALNYEEMVCYDEKVLFNVNRFAPARYREAVCRNYPGERGTIAIRK